MKNDNESMAAYVARIAADAVAANFDGTAIIARDGTRTVPADDGVRVESREVRRDESGRCTRAVYRYADGSRLTFTWARSNGAKIATA